VNYLLKKLKMAVLVVLTYKNFVAIFADYAGLYRKKEMIVTVRGGAKYKIRSRRVTKTDFYVLNESWLYKLHAELAKQYIAPGAVVMDIGAHIGAFTIYAATRAPCVRVLSFEPEKENFKLLLDNVSLNKLGERVAVFNKAVTGTTGKMNLFKSTTDTGQHTFFEKRLSFENVDHKKDMVDCTTLKNVFDENRIETIDLIKIDCEGMEYEILYNTPADYLKRIRALSIEHHWVPGRNYEDLAGYLKKHGFAIRYPKKEFALIHAYRQ